MNQDLEALIQAYIAAQECSGDEKSRFRQAFEELLAGVCERNPSASRNVILLALHRRVDAYVRAQNRTSSIPPKA